jgi:hypothetical protein
MTRTVTCGAASPACGRRLSHQTSDLRFSFRHVPDCCRSGGQMSWQSATCLMMAPAVLALGMLLVHGSSRHRSLVQRNGCCLSCMQSCLISAWRMERPSLPRCWSCQYSRGMRYTRRRACGHFAPKPRECGMSTQKLELLTGAIDAHLHPEAAATAECEPKDGDARVSVAWWSRRRLARMHLQRGELAV